MATATVQASYPNNAWDSQIVPTLRKRLESESRMLENRLSAGRLSGEDPTPRGALPAVQSSTPSRSRSPNANPPPLYPTRSTSQQHYYSNESGYGYGSAIPRPSLSNDVGTRSHTAAMPMNVSSANISSRSGSSSRNGGGGNPQASQKPSVNGEYKRARTHSTPYPFDRENSADAQAARRSPSGTNVSAANGIPTPASSRANSPMIGTSASSKANLNERPTKIPMRRRQRSDSQTGSSSKPGSTPKGSGFAKKRSTGADPVQHQPVMFPPSPETSPELWLDRDRPSQSSSSGPNYRTPDNDPPIGLNVPKGVDKIADERAPFNPNRVSRASFEEREFEHWYRGEGRDGGGRNGGRGEIKVAKADTTKEMLEIAVGGHIIPGRDRWAPRRRLMDPEDSLAGRRREPDSDMEYVMDEQELTDMDGDAYVTDYGQELDPYPRYNAQEPSGEDLDDYYYSATGGQEISAHSIVPPLPSESMLAGLTRPSRRSLDLRIPSQPGSRAPSRASLTPSHHSGAPPTKLPQATPTKDRRPSTDRRQSNDRRPSTDKRPATTSGAQTRKASGGPSTPRSPDPRARTQSRVRQRAVSRPGAASSGGDPLADAIPPFASSPPLPNDGNWDDVVLPTVAKKMGLTASQDTAITMLGSAHDPQKTNQGQARKVYEPAPGTFAYDATKARSPTSSVLDEFGGTRLTSQDGGRRSDQSSPRPVSPPPFSSYMPVPGQGPVLESAQPHPAQGVPTPKPAETKKTKPSIVVTSPSEVGAPGRTTKPQDDDEGAGCCKCVIM